MFALIGLVVLLAMVFGGFIFTGGDIGPVLHALPHEMLIIGGAAVGALIIGNSGADLMALGGGLGKVFKGPKYKKQDFLDCIFLVSRLMKTLRVEGPVALEPHIEDPASSTIFSEYPRLMADKTLIHLMSDTLRLVVVSSGTLDPHAVEEVMDNALKTHHHEALKPADNLQGLADALPALGIVAAARTPCTQHLRYLAGKRRTVPPTVFIHGGIICLFCVASTYFSVRWPLCRKNIAGTIGAGFRPGNYRIVIGAQKK